MGYNTKISWCDHSWNGWIGCSRVSEGCRFCYAETLMDTRYGRVTWGPQGTRVRTSEENWRKPLAWNRQEWHECRACGWRGRWESTSGDESQVCCPICGKCNTTPTRQRVFCASLADVFEDRPELEEWRDDLWELIHNTPNLDWLLLTKRPENVVRMMNPVPTENVPAPYLAGGDYLPNVWLGTSIENQETADKRIPELLKIPARVRFLSVEPMLGPVDFRKVPGFNQIGLSLSGWWVICGGESGPHARPMHPDWVRSIRDQCQSAGVPFHFKQWGELIAESQMGEELHRRWDYHHGTEHAHGPDAPVWKVGKKAAGRLLDGREWNEFPDTEKAGQLPVWREDCTQ